MKNFAYTKPDNLDDVLAALGENDNSYLLAGGTDLIVGLKTNNVRPKCLINLKGIPELSAINYDNGFRIGALVTVREIEVSALVREKLPVLSEAAGTLGSIQIRNRATVGGNLCHASPAADMATALLAMNCKVKIASVAQERIIGLDQFFTAPNSTVLGKREVLAEIIIPSSSEQFKGIYLKHGPRKAMDIGIVNIAILLDADIKSGLCRQVMIAMGAVAPTPIRAVKTEAFLTGKALKPEIISEAAELAASETNPINDFRASADYRQELVKNLVTRGLETSSTLIGCRK